MTTALTEDKRQVAAAGVAYFANAEPLIRAISNGLLFAGSGDTLPALCAIKFEFDGSKLQTLSTDRYRLCIETVELDRTINHEGQPAFAFLLPRDAAKSVLAALKANKRWPLTVVQVQGEHGRMDVEFRFVEQTARYATCTCTFPAVRSLVPDPKDRIEVNEIAFQPAFLADLGKVQCESRLVNVRIGLYGKTKPTRIDYQDGPTVLLMPVKTEKVSDDSWGSV